MSEDWFREMADRFPDQPASTPWVAGPSAARRSTPRLLLWLLGGILVFGLLSVAAFKFLLSVQPAKSMSGDVPEMVTLAAHQSEVRNLQDEIQQLQRLLQEQSRRAELAELRATMSETKAQVRNTTSVPAELGGATSVLPAPEIPPEPSERPLPQAALPLPPAAPSSLPDATAVPLPGGPVAPDTNPNELSRSRVFLHYPPEGRAAAQELEQELQGSVAYLELRAVAAAPSVPVVRFFFAADRSPAEELVRRLGTSWRIQDFTTETTKPRRGTLEVWLPRTEATQ